MKCLNFLGFFLFLLNTSSLCQIDNSGIFLTDIKGGILKGKINSYENIEGSPYFDDEWTNSEITLKNGDVFSNIPSKINFHLNEVHVLDKKNTELILPNLSLSKITFSKKLVNYEFITGINPKTNKTVLFRILNDGQIQLIRFTERKITEIKDYNSAVAVNKLKEESSLFLLSNKKVITIEKSRDFWLSQLGDKKEKIEIFLDQRKNKIKSEKDILELLDFYNQ